MIEAIPDGVMLTIRVIPGSRGRPARAGRSRGARAGGSGPAGSRDNAILIHLNARPIEGAANKELIELLADLLRVPKRSVTIVSGERSRTKRVRVAGVTAEHARAALDVA